MLHGLPVLTPSLLCRTCGKPATHVHFIPWIEEPARVELACEKHEPGGDDSEWYRLDEVAAEPGFLAAVKRAPASPPALVSWLEGHKPEAAAPAPVDAAEPLTVAQAAEHRKCSDKTIYRLLPELEANGDAWRVGGRERGPWRIDRAALDQQKVAAQVPKSRPLRTKLAPTPKAAGKKAAPATANPHAWRRP